MCLQSSLSIMEQVVQENVSKREMFTGFDASWVAHNKGMTERHREVREEYHAFYNRGLMGDYLNASIHLEDVPDVAILFYPPEKDPADYVSPNTGKRVVKVNGVTVTRLTIAAGLPPAQLPPPPASISIIDSDDATDDGSPDQYTVDNRSRLCLPKNMITALGLSPGGIAYAIKGQADTTPCLSIKTTLGPYDDSASAYKVDKSGNVRISKSCLDEAGIGGTSYRIDGTATCITVRLPIPVGTPAPAIVNATPSLSAT